MENLLSSNPVSRRTDPVSSSLAEIEVSRRARGEQQRAVLFAVIENPGCTSMELSVACGLDRYQVARRLPELEKVGLVRKGPIGMCQVSGRKAVTWCAK